MITFRLRLPCRTILRVFSRNPLVRGTDRLEAVVMLLAVTVSLLTIRSPPRPAPQSMIPAATSMPTRPRPAIPQPRP